MKAKKYIRPLLLVLILWTGCTQTVRASVWNQATDYYLEYGGEPVFHPTSETDGKVYFGSRGASSTSGIKYRTIGWKLLIRDNNDKLLQTIYFALGGKYLKRVDNRKSGDYEYNLYAFQLSDMQSRMKGQALNLLREGKVSIRLNACMVVVKNGVVQGSMNDSGPVSGVVYTTYDGIVGAQDWSVASKVALQSYYGKSVQGLFYSVKLSKGSGIASVSGEGNYCYGTKAVISAQVQKGYTFSKWSGPSTETTAKVSFLVNDNSKWTAYATVMKTTVTFYRNQSGADQTSVKATFQFQKKNQAFPNPGWTRAGYYQSGWGSTRSQSRRDYSTTAAVSDNWIVEHYASTKLYAIWLPNTYTIRFVQQNPQAVIKTMRVDVTQTIVMPDAPMDSFAGWSLHAKPKSGKLYDAKTEMTVAALAKEAGVLNTDQAVITIYALSDAVPAVEARDMYFTVQEARSGKLTEAFLCKYARAYDMEDGILTPVIMNYDAAAIGRLADRATLPLIFAATDSDGNCTKKTVYLTVVDTESSRRKIRVRLISKPYADLQTGLSEKSVWWNNPVYRALLMKAFEAK